MATKKRSRGAKRGRPPKLSNVSTEAMVSELASRRRSLEAQRDELQGQLDSIEGQLAQLDGFTELPQKRTGGKGIRRTKRTTRTRRRRGGKSLADTMQQVLQGKTMSATEVTSAVKKAGYKSRSPNLKNMVSQQLVKNPDRFKRVARGQYTAR